MLLQPSVLTALQSAVVPKYISTIARYNDEYNETDDYEYDYREPPRGKINRNRRSNGMVEFLQNPKQVGASLVTFGLFFTLLSMILLFERNLLRIGNLLLISGAVMLIGPRSVSGFFLQESRMQATVIIAIGVLLVFWGKARMGLIVEIFGVLNLFGNMFPFLFAMVRNLPGVSDLLDALGLNGPSPFQQPNNRRRPPPQYNPRNYKYYPQF